MESLPTAESFGDLVEVCLTRAKNLWLTKHAAGRDPESFWSKETVEAHCNVAVKHGGRATVYITIIARSSWRCETFPYHLERVAPRQWRERTPKPRKKGRVRRVRKGSAD